MADGRGHDARPRHLPPDRAQPVSRPRLQRGLSGVVVASHPQPLREQRQGWRPGDQPVVGRRPDPDDDRDDQDRPIQSPPAYQLRQLGSDPGRPVHQAPLGGAGGLARLALPDQGDPPRRPAIARRVLLGRPDHAVRLRTELEAPLRDARAAVHLPGLSRRGEGTGAEGSRGVGRGVGPVRLADGDHVLGDWRQFCSPGARDRAGLRDVPLGGGRSLHRDGLAGRRRGGGQPLVAALQPADRGTPPGRSRPLTSRRGCPELRWADRPTIARPEPGRPPREGGGSQPQASRIA